MARENFLWGAPRIHGELLMLGFTVSQATVLGVPAQGQPSFFSPFFRRSAHRFFIIRDSRLLPAGVRPRFFLFETVEAEPLCLLSAIM